MKLALIFYLQLLLTNISTDQADTLKLLFLGDIMQHQAQLDAARIKGGKTDDPNSYDYTSYFQNLKTRFSKVDMRIANMETTFAKPPYSGYPHFCSPSTLLSWSRKAGIDMFLAANNHICDKGKRGLEETMDVYDSLRVLYTGIYRNQQNELEKNPLVVEIKGFRIAFLNYTYATNGIPVPQPFVVKLIDTASIRADLKRTREKNPDFIIVCLHWGEEYVLKHSASQERIEKFIYANGADVIIGSHPHVIQDYNVEYGINGEINHVTIYSLGNAISNMTAPNTRTGMVAEIVLSKDSEGNKRILAPTVEYIWTTRPKLFKKNFSIISKSEK